MRLYIVLDITYRYNMIRDVELMVFFLDALQLSVVIFLSDSSTCFNACL